MGMSDLIPNLNDLRTNLPSQESAPDVHAFVEALAKAGSVAGAQANVDALVDSWLELPYGSE